MYEKMKSKMNKKKPKLTKKNLKAKKAGDVVIREIIDRLIEIKKSSPSKSIVIIISLQEVMIFFSIIDSEVSIHSILITHQ